MQRSGWKDYLLWVCFVFSFLTTIPIAALWEGCWSLSQLHTGEGREHPWKRVRRLPRGASAVVLALAPLPNVQRQEMNQGLSLLSTTALLIVWCCFYLFIFFSAQLKLTHHKHGLFYFENSMDDLFSFPYPTSCPACFAL